MTNVQLVYGSYTTPTTEKREQEKLIKAKTLDLIAAIDGVQMPEAQKEAAKRDIITGMMWVVKALYINN